MGRARWLSWVVGYQAWQQREFYASPELNATTCVVGRIWNRGCTWFVTGQNGKYHIIWFKFILSLSHGIVFPARVSRFAASVPPASHLSSSCRLLITTAAVYIGSHTQLQSGVMCMFLPQLASPYRNVLLGGGMETTKV